MTTKTIKVDILSRVEGEGSLYIKIRGRDIKEVKFKIFEPPRFFEALLRGRDYSEAPDITARICGICPVAYQMSAVHAMENAFGIRVEGQLRALRRLLYCGEWIESHGLHVYMLHAPDFLGYDDSIRMAIHHPEVVKQGLELKKIGNEIISLLGGRAIHPVNVRVGGFYKVPTKKELLELEGRLKLAEEIAIETVKWVSGFTFPDFEEDYEFVSLSHPDEYPFNEGKIVSNKGLNISFEKYEDIFFEKHVDYSNALHSELKGHDPYIVGPLARFNLNFDKLSATAKEAAKLAGVENGCKNPYKSIIVRSIEMVYACSEALRIIHEYEEPREAAIEIHPTAGTGYSCTEAPRGTLYHRYKVDEKGKIIECNIVAPTSQNQKRIEQDLWDFLPKYIDMEKDKLTWICEQLVRSYDPCISCATHFIKLDIDR